MEYYLRLDFLYIFLHYIHMGFTFSKRLFISLHFAKTRMKIQIQKLQKLNFLDAELPWLHWCEKRC